MQRVAFEIIVLLMTAIVLSVVINLVYAVWQKRKDKTYHDMLREWYRR